MGPLLRTPEEGADTLVWLAADDGLPVETTGRFWLDRRPRAIHRLARTRRSDTPDERHHRPGGRPPPAPAAVAPSPPPV
jgi:hypothetical protein